MKPGAYAHFTDTELAYESLQQNKRVQECLNDDEREHEEHRLFIIDGLLEYRKALAIRFSAPLEPEPEKIFPPRRVGFPREKYAKQRKRSNETRL